MTVQELSAAPGDVGNAVKAWVAATASFVQALSDNNISVEFGPAGTSNTNVDYDSPPEASYQKTYKPITADDIVQMNKTMQNALRGENFIEGFLTCLQIIAMFARP